MAKFLDDSVLDKATAEIATAVLQTLCAGQPATRQEAIDSPSGSPTGKALADVAMGGGDFSQADGATDGRKVTMAEKTNVAVDVSGTGDHVALVGPASLLAVTGVEDATVVAAGNDVTLQAWSITLRDFA